MKRQMFSIFVVCLMFLFAASPNLEAQTEETFTIEVNSNRLAVYQGELSWVYVNVSSVGGFSGTVNLQIIGSPAFLKTALWPTEIQLSRENRVTHSKMMLYAEPYAEPGSYVLQVVGVSGGIKQAANITVEPFQPVFTVQIEPSVRRAIFATCF